MTIAFRDRLKATVTNTPVTGDFVVGPAVSNFLTFTSAEDTYEFDMLIEEGSAWELRERCTYTHSTTALTRGVLVNSSTGSAVSFTSAATISNVPLAKRQIQVDIAANTFFGGL